MLLGWAGPLARSNFNKLEGKHLCYMECAAKGLGKCDGAQSRRCGSCGVVSYCSVSHQLAHWPRHREECDRLGQQIKRADELNTFPFSFSDEATIQLLRKRESKCSFLKQRGLHRKGIWMFECSCHDIPDFWNNPRLKNLGWELTSKLCPCLEPSSPLPDKIIDWASYYEWRRLPLNSPASLLLHWPLTIYHISQIVNSKAGASDELIIHYLGPEKEIMQLSAFRELLALFPGVKLIVEMIGPAIPETRDGEEIQFNSYPECVDKECGCKHSESNNSSIKIRLYRGYYHERYREVGSSPHWVIGLNAGIGAYTSWMRTVEVIKRMNVAAVFSDYCEEACHIAAQCLRSVTGCDLSLQIQVNPFRQPIAVADSVLSVPCYANCFLFAM